MGFPDSIHLGSVSIIGKAPDGSAVPLALNADGGINSSTVTQNAVGVGASASGTIPAGAKGWSFKLLTGTGTFGGIAISGSFADSDPGVLAAAIAYTTAAGSSAYVRYGT